MPMRSTAAVLATLVASALAAACVSVGPQIELRNVSPAQRGRRMATVDVMPVATVVDVYPQHPLDRAAAEIQLRSWILASLLADLPARRWISAVIDRRGMYSVGRIRQAMTADEVADTLAAMARYERVQRRSSDRLLPITLPHRLGRASSADATLFVGGQAYAGDEQTDMVEVLEALQLINVVATGAATVAAAASGDDALDGAARAAEIAARGLEDIAIMQETIDDLRPVRHPRSHLWLTVTLVDNRTGAVLWHSNRAFQMDPTDPVWARRAFALTARRLPCGSAAPGKRRRPDPDPDVLAPRCR
jgi:hypothetical protein